MARVDTDSQLTQPAEPAADQQCDGSERTDDQAALHEHLGQALHAALGDPGQVSVRGTRRSVRS